jgi:hypothetical protein
LGYYCGALSQTLEGFLPVNGRANRKLPRFILMIVALTIGLAVLMVTDLLPYLRGGFGWRWPYDPASVGRVLPLVVAIVVYGVVAWWLLKRGVHPGLTLVWAIVGSALLPLVAIYARFDNIPYELYARTIDRLTSGQQNAAAVIGWGGDAWRNWAAFVQRPDWAGGHVAVAPPGLPMWYAFLGHLLDQTPTLTQPFYRILLSWQCQNYDVLVQSPGNLTAAWFGMAMPLWGSLGVLPLYLIARHFPRTRRLALALALWFPMIPSLIMFTPDWNVFYPCLSLLIFGLLILGIERRHWYWLVLSGLLMGTALFMVFTFAPLAVLMGLYVLIYVLWVERPAHPESFRWYRPVVIGLWFALGMTIPWILYWAWSGASPVAIATLSLTTHLDIDRPYLPWVFIHYWDWTLFNGFAFMLVWYIGLVTWWRRRQTDIPVLGLALVITVVLLAVSGTGRGESGRVWSIFTPLALLAAADGLDRRLETPAQTSDEPAVLDKVRISAWALLLFAQAVLAVALVYALNVINTDLTFPPNAPASPTEITPVQADFKLGDGGTIRLLGWHSSVSDDRITLQLRWQAVDPVLHPYWFTAVLVSPDGNIYNAGQWQPGGAVSLDSQNATRGTYPTTCWAPNVTLGDTAQLTIPKAVGNMHGAWWLSLGAVGDLGGSSQPLTVILPTGAQDKQIGLGPIAVP